MSSNPQKVAIIGAGVAGLAAAVRLTAQGHTVDVFEANSYPGGKLSEWYEGPYRFDAGPSLFTMPQYVQELFALAGEGEADFQFERLPVVCHYFWNDDTRLKAFADAKKFDEECYQVLDSEMGAEERLLGEARKKYDLVGQLFLESSLHKLSTWTNTHVLKAIRKLPQLDVFSNMHQVHKSHTQSDKLVQLFDRFATYNGSNPYKASGLLSMIPHFEHGFGAYFPKGGMYTIVKEILRLAEKQGAKIHFNRKVDEILQDGRKVTGIQVGDQKLYYDTVVSNMDVFFTYEKLLPEIETPNKILTQERSTSALIFYWGIKETFEELGLHNIFFADNYQKEFQALSEQKIIDDPTVYVNISSKLNPSDAPQGCENWFTMINVPYSHSIDWDIEIPRIREKVLEKLSRILKRDVRSLIESESILDPRGIEAKTSAYLGALYGSSSNTLFSAFLRQANFSQSLNGLYFCGGTVHPGGGIPLCLLSAKIVAELIDEAE
ncbi:MAG: phytoene desaturase [Saprospiraceae bacterium]|nr:phytoene desaturase [Saprospiraceae bacterium]